jgi:hypothetical protein
MNYHQACWAYTIYKEICRNKDTDRKTVELFVAPNDTDSLVTHHQRFYDSGYHCKVDRATDFQVWVFVGDELCFIPLEDYLR